MRKRLLFIDHAMHRTTRTTQFLINLLKSAFGVREHFYERFYQVGAGERH